jgi:thiopeptide-type bacteriocin biosynthesis protein
VDTDSPPRPPRRHAGFFALRTPLLPFEAVAGLSAGLEAPHAAAAARAAALENDRRRVRDRLRALAASPLVREALFVASPDFCRSLDVWRAAPESDRGQAIERALLRYLTRMASRPTPFGLFAGTAAGAIATRTRLSVPPAEQCRRHTRLDMDYLVALAAALAREPALAATLRYTPNTSLHRSAGRWHYVESRALRDGRAHHLVAIDDAEPLQQVLARARCGATRAELAALLAAGEVSAADAEAYIAELVDSQILVPELECPITGDEPLGVLIAALQRHDAGRDAAARLSCVSRALAAIDEQAPGAPVAAYDAIRAVLEPFGVPIVASKLFQADLVKHGEPPVLAADLVDEIARGVDVLRRLTPHRENALARLKAAFQERYEQREVALVDMLDEETGIGSALAEGGDRDASPLLDGLDFAAPAAATIPWTRREQGLLWRAGLALAEGQRELALSARDIDELAVDDPPPLPTAYAAMVTIAGSAAGDGAPVRDVRLLLHGAHGPSGAALLGRFCHADPSLARAVAAHLREEEAADPDAVFAEIVHLPEGRLGNILMRPLLRDYEIVYLGRSGAPVERQLPVDDLRVALEDGRFVLRSARLGRRVIPRLTSAHNYMRLSVGVYRFLCLLQGDGAAAVCAWSWGALEQLPFLPRVTFGRLVLARARWRLSAAEISTLTRAAGDGRYAAVQELRQRRWLPRWVVLADHDNTLVVDLDNVAAAGALVHLLAGGSDAALLEHYPDADGLCAGGAAGAYTHEIVVPFVADVGSGRGSVTTSVPAVARPAPDASRYALPGSAWVYAKLYLGAAAGDRVLTEVIGPLSRQLAARGVIDRWFFVRYADPETHLRWRLRASAPRDVTALRKAIEKAGATLFGDGRVRRVAFDTYHREIERYGGVDALDTAEDLFRADSETVIDLLAGPATATPDARWQAALLGAHALAVDLDPALEARLELLRRARKNWGPRAGVDATTRRQLAKKFRQVQAALEALLEGRADPGSPLGAIAALVAERSARMRGGIERLRGLHAEGKVSVAMAALAESLIHMHLNRMFRADQNLHEVVIYDFLVQLYTRQRLRQPQR